MADLTGKTLGHYQIVELIGHGTLADVYRAVYPAEASEAAVKVLPAKFLDDSSFLLRLTKEAEKVAELDHPRILSVYMVGQEEGFPYIAMEYLAAGSLGAFLSERPDGVNPPAVAHVVDEVGDALDLAHKAGVYHGDLRPANIFIDNKGDAYLSDLGFGAVIDSAARQSGVGRVGKPAYRAPEMADISQANALTDVYALGIVAYQMLIGKRPFEGARPDGAPLPNLLDARPDLPAHTQTVIEKATAPAPADRYQTAGGFATFLRAALEGKSE